MLVPLVSNHTTSSRLYIRLMEDAGVTTHSYPLGICVEVIDGNKDRVRPVFNQWDWSSRSSLSKDMVIAAYSMSCASAIDLAGHTFWRLDWVIWRSRSQ